MKKLTALVLLALLGLLPVACDATGDSLGTANPDASVLEVDAGNPDVTIGEADETDTPALSESVSPVPISVGLDVRLSWNCGPEEVTGYRYNSQLLVTPGSEGQPIPDYHEDIQENLAEVHTSIYKGTELWDPYTTTHDMCEPDSGITTVGYALPAVPSTPDEYLITVGVGHALMNGYHPPYVYYVPDADLTVEVLCHGALVSTTVVNPIELGVGVNTGIDIGILTTTGECAMAPVENPLWCVIGEGGCGL